MLQNFNLKLISLLHNEISFVAYSLPGMSSVQLMIDDNTSPLLSARKFIITNWDGDCIEIRNRVQPITINHCNSYSHQSNRFSNRRTTTWPDYQKGLDIAIDYLRNIDGKVVISRQKIVENEALYYETILDCISEMFDIYRNTFRAIYFTPTTGAWCVCSPELLLNVDKMTGRLSTVALAGTRRKSEIAEPWDDKNMEEHAYVVRHISRVLSNIGVDVEINNSETISAGNVDHILTRIIGGINRPVTSKFIYHILSLLHPTPAICGYPLEEAKNIICKIEHHDRECYGGYLAIEDETKLYAHVNLRCFAFEEGRCCFWGGGGILRNSIPINEWEEAGLKIDSTLSFIQNAINEK